MKKKKIKIIYFLIPIITIIIFIIIYFFFKKSTANYYIDNKYDYSFSSAGMYLSSDILTAEPSSTVQILNYDYSKIYFTVNNFESDTQISTKDINYTMNCGIIGEGYSCYIDDTEWYLDNQTLHKSYNCSISGYTEAQCKNDPNATLTYNKVTNTHSVYVKKVSGSDLSSVTITITIGTSSPYHKIIGRSISLTFDNSRKGVIIEKIGENDFQCEYLITNNTDTNNLCFSARNNSYIKFMDNNSNQLCLNINKYSKETIKTFKKKTESCTDGISLVQS